MMFLVAAAASDTTARKWLFDVSESLVAALVGGLGIAVVGKRLRVSAFDRIRWSDLVVVGFMVALTFGNLILVLSGHPMSRNLLILLIGNAVAGSVIGIVFWFYVRGAAERSEEHQKHVDWLVGRRSIPWQERFDALRRCRRCANHLPVGASYCPSCGAQQ